MVLLATAMDLLKTMDIKVAMDPLRIATALLATATDLLVTAMDMEDMEDNTTVEMAVSVEITEVLVDLEVTSADPTEVLAALTAVLEDLTAGLAALTVDSADPTMEDSVVDQEDLQDLDLELAASPVPIRWLETVLLLVAILAVLLLMYPTPRLPLLPMVPASLLQLQTSPLPRLHDDCFMYKSFKHDMNHFLNFFLFHNQ